MLLERLAEWQQLKHVGPEAAEGPHDAPKGYPGLGHVHRGHEQFQGHWQSALFVVPPPRGEGARAVPKPGRR